MKKLLLITVLFFGAISSKAHVTKADIESMLTELGTTLDRMDNIFIGNTMTYFNDGTSKQWYDNYTKEKGNKFILTETGFKIVYKPGGVVTSIFFVPYTNIITIDIGLDYINIYLIK